MPASNTALEDTKTWYRNDLRQSLKRIKSADRKLKSQVILKRLLKTAEYRNARHILTYVSLPDEVDTRHFIRQAIRDGKYVYVPRIYPARKKIKLFQIASLREDLRKGSFGIAEPIARKSRQARPAELDLVIVPGLGFDRKGARLGRGAGYFDRFLSRTKNAVRIGLSFRQQLRTKIPAGRHDVRMDRVVTD